MTTPAHWIFTFRRMFVESLRERCMVDKMNEWFTILRTWTYSAKFRITAWSGGQIGSSSSQPHRSTTAGNPLLGTVSKPVLIWSLAFFSSCSSSFFLSFLKKKRRKKNKVKESLSHNPNPYENVWINLTICSHRTSSSHGCVRPHSENLRLSAINNLITSYCGIPLYSEFQNRNASILFLVLRAQ